MSKFSKQFCNRSPLKQHKEEYTDEQGGGEVSSKETKRRRVEKYKGGEHGKDYKSKQVTKRNPKDDTEFIVKTKTRKDGVTEVEKENKRFWKRKVGGKTVSKYDKKKKRWVKGGPDISDETRAKLETKMETVSERKGL
tara:strand:+ start:505 stop:918 length:414 start_codon:yes stop_codon:yes gene_type:complete